MRVQYLSPIHETCSAHLILHLITLYLVNYKSWSSSLCNFLHSPFTFSFLGCIFLSTQSQTSSAHVLPLQWDHVTHPYKTTGKITVLYIFIFVLLDSSMGRLKILNWRVANITWIESAPNYSCMQFWSVGVTPKYLPFATLSKVLFLSLQCDFYLHSADETWYILSSLRIYF